MRLKKQVTKVNITNGIKTVEMHSQRAAQLAIQVRNGMLKKDEPLWRIGQPAVASNLTEENKTSDTKKAKK